MAKRRSLTPGAGSGTGDVHATRRGAGGARKEVTDRVILRDGDAELTGWALNASRGGIRIIIEDKVELGHEYAVVLGNDEDGGKGRMGRVVWIQEEADGMIVGLEFTGGSPSDLPGEGPPPSETGTSKGSGR